MKPQEKGWLKEYLDFRKSLLMDLTSEKERKRSHPEYSLYRVVQPTGLMYGHTVGSISHPNEADWDDQNKMKVLLAESLISSSLLFHEKSISNPEELSDIIVKTLENIGNFYNNIFPELSTRSKNLFGKRKSPLEVAERILDKRIEHTSNFSGNFWTQFFHNSLLFLDIFIYGQWIHTNADEIVSDFFRYEREELRFSVVKIIAAATHANREIAVEEKRLFEYFIESTDLSSEKRKQAIKIFEEGIEIESINIPFENSWILKKFFLEMAILTIWADKKVEEQELEFLKRLCAFINFNDDDLENSMIAIEGFVLENWEQLDKLQDKQNYDQVSEQFIKRVARIAEKNKSRLKRQLDQREDMLRLLTKARSTELSDDEKERMRKELIETLRTIPTFVIVSLPQRFLTLPMLLKILPKNLFTGES